MNVLWCHKPFSKGRHTQKKHNNHRWRNVNWRQFTSKRRLFYTTLQAGNHATTSGYWNRDFLKNLRNRQTGNRPVPVHVQIYLYFFYPLRETNISREQPEQSCLLRVHADVCLDFTPPSASKAHTQRGRKCGAGADTDHLYRFINQGPETVVRY